jgi:hypothetical protein
VVAADISEVGQCPERTAQRGSLRQQEKEALENPRTLLKLKRIGIFYELDKQLLLVSHAAAALIDTRVCPIAAVSEAAPLTIPEIAVPRQNERLVPHEAGWGRGHRAAIGTGALLAALVLGCFGGSNLYRYFDTRDELSGSAAINAVVERIVDVESNGDPNAKNSRSSATGPGQFLNETWLDLIRAYRPDLARGHNESEILELRHDTKLAREITTRFVERNAAMLRQRGFPVTAGTAYLAHFAGGAGAVAILSAPENADAALAMVSGDATGRTKREQIIKANPFLERFTVADLKIWADHKMRRRGFHLMDVFAANAKN